MHFPTLPAVLLLASSNPANAFPIHIPGFRRQVEAKSELATFQASAANFTNEVINLKSLLDSSGICPVTDRLPDFQSKLKSFSNATSAWSIKAHALMVEATPLGADHGDTQVFQQELSQLDTELSAAVSSDPADSTGSCASNPVLVQLNMGLGQFITQLSSYNGYLSAFVQQHPDIPAATTTTSMTTSAASGPDNAQLTAPSDMSATAVMVSIYPEYTMEAASTPVQTSAPQGKATAAITSPAATTTAGHATNVSGSITKTKTSAASSSTPSTTFNKAAKNNVAVYYGQTALTGSTTLADQCSDPSIDIVILAFLNVYAGANGYPGVDFGAACGGQSSEQQLNAPDLLSCPDLAANITSCQGMGKKVFISLGGAVGQTTFPDDATATKFGQTLWDLFAGGTKYSADMRPFGSVKIDGFDLDNESNNPTGYTALAKSLRNLFSTDSSKTYYISAAPQCPYPDASIPLDAMALADFVWVQFYNNFCSIGSSSFLTTLTSWSTQLASLNPKTQLYIGLLSWSGGGNGYVTPTALKQELDTVQSQGLSNFGGIMLWDGPEGRANVLGGQSYVQTAKSLLAAA